VLVSNLLDSRGPEVLGVIWTVGQAVSRGRGITRLLTKVFFLMSVLHHGWIVAFGDVRLGLVRERHGALIWVNLTVRARIRWMKRGRGSQILTSLSGVAIILLELVILRVEMVVGAVIVRQILRLGGLNSLALLASRLLISGLVAQPPAPLSPLQLSLFCEGRLLTPSG
jgi:hypothetical protein